MSEKIRKKVNSEISLHDARVNSICIDSIDMQFDLYDGFYQITGSEVVQTGKSSIRFYDLDFNFCKVFYYDEKILDNVIHTIRIEVDLDRFLVDINRENSWMDIIDETYGYNQAKFTGYIHMDDDYYECDIEIYYFGEMKYIWEES